MISTQKPSFQVLDSVSESFGAGGLWCLNDSTAVLCSSAELVEEGSHERLTGLLYTSVCLSGRDPCNLKLCCKTIGVNQSAVLFPHDAYKTTGTKSQIRHYEKSNCGKQACKAIPK